MRLHDATGAQRPPGLPSTSSSWSDQIACWVIRHAALRAPPELTDRLEEEWLADLHARPGKLSRMRLALGCSWAAAVIAQEHLATGLTAATTTGHKTMSSYARTEGSLVPQRTTALILIIGIHVGLVVAFASGLARNVIAVIPPMINIPMVDRPPPDPPQLPPLTAKPTLSDPRLQFTDPKVDIAVALDEVPPIRDMTYVGPTEPALPLPSPAKPITRVAGGVGKGFPDSDDYYPPSSIRSGETGTSAIQVCVNAVGRLTSSPTLIATSGSARLDEGALKLAKAGSGHYRPTTEDGRPVDSCYGIRVTFKVKG